MRLNLCQLLTLSMAFTLFSCSTPPEMPKKVVETEVVKKTPFQFSIKLMGVVEPVQSSVLRAKSAGVVDLHARAGDALKKGDIIASLQDPPTQETLALAEKEAAIAKEQYDRAALLGGKKTLSTQDVEGKRMAHLQAQRQFYSIKKQYEDGQFLAPFDGIVGVFKVREGAFMQAGDALVTFYKPDHLLVSFDIPGDFLPRVKKDQAVRIGDKNYPLSGVQHMMDPETHMGPAYIHYDEKNALIGQNVELDLVIFEDKNVISVPHDALYYVGEGRNRAVFVYLVKDGKADLHPVKVGHSNRERTLITKGLKEEDVIVSKGITRLFPGIEIVVHDEKAIHSPSHDPKAS